MTAPAAPRPMSGRHPERPHPAAAQPHAPFAARRRGRRGARGREARRRVQPSAAAFQKVGHERVDLRRRERRAERGRHDSVGVPADDHLTRVDDRLADVLGGGLAAAVLGRVGRPGCSGSGRWCPVEPAGVKVWQPLQPALLNVAAASVVRRRTTAAAPSRASSAGRASDSKSAGFITTRMLRIWLWPMPHSSAHTIA